MSRACRFSCEAAGIGRRGVHGILDEVTTEHLVSVQRHPRTYEP
ncbi:MAG: hypothetical protein ACYDHN_12035 [Solirubrobacteraceae bacterium]